MKLIQRIGIAAAIVYGLLGIFTTLVTVIAFSVPIGSAFLNMLGIFVALPFMIYPFWWMGVSFIAGILVTLFWMRTKKNGK